LTDSARYGGPDEKIPPAPGTNQIAGFVEFRPLTSREKDKPKLLLFIKTIIMTLTNLAYLQAVFPSVAHCLLRVPCVVNIIVTVEILLCTNARPHYSDVFWSNMAVI